MSVAKMRIDRPGSPGQAPADTYGFARTDAQRLEVITLNSLGDGLTHRFRFLWTPDGVTQPPLTQLDARTYEFTTLDADGPYRIELIVDEGLETETREIRILGVRDAAGNLPAAYGERADAAASLQRQGSAQVAASERNEITVTYPGGNPFGWEGATALGGAPVGPAAVLEDGSVPFIADQSMGGARLTDVGAAVAPGDAVNRSTLDAALLGITWRRPVAVRELVGNATIATIDGLAPTTGDAYVALDAGTPAAGASDAATAGDVLEFDGTQWLVVVQAVGGFPPAGTRALASVQTALVAPYTDGVEDGAILEFDGASLTGAVTAEATDGAGLLIAGEQSVFENQQYVFDGAVPTGAWIQIGGGAPSGGVVDPGTNGFRLSPISGESVPTADVAGATTVYAVPHRGNAVALYTGAAWQVLTSAEISYTLAGRTAGLPFDLFYYDSGGGVLALEVVDWASATARAVALARLDGVWVRAGDSTRRWAGTVRPRAATTYDWLTEGLSAQVRADLFNADNRVEVPLHLTDTGAQFLDQLPWHQWRNSTLYEMQLVVGIEGVVFRGVIVASVSHPTQRNSVGWGLDGAGAGNIISRQVMGSIADNVGPPTPFLECTADLVWQMPLGVRRLTWCQQTAFDGANFAAWTAAQGLLPTRSGCNALWYC